MAETVPARDSRAIIGWNGHFAHHEDALPLLVLEEDGEMHAVSAAEVSTEGLGHIVTTPPRPIPTQRTSVENQSRPTTVHQQAYAPDSSIYLG